MGACRGHRADADSVRVLIAARVTDAWLRACSMADQVALAREAEVLAVRRRGLTRQLNSKRYSTDRPAT